MNTRFLAKVLKLIPVIILLFIFSCNSDSPTTGGNNTPVDSSAFKYPFTNGSSWNYTHNITVSNIRPDSIKHYFSGFPVNGTGTVSIQYDTAINSVSTKCFLETYIENSHTFTSRVYFINNDTALIEYAYRLESGSEFMPVRKIENGINFTLGNKNFRSLANQSIYLRYGVENVSQIDTLMLNIPPRISLKYPVKTGTQWIVVFFPPADTITKKYLGFENISVGNNIISCVKVQRRFSYISEGTSIDYVSKYGVAKKEFSILNETVGDEFGNILGYIDWNESYQLTSYNIVYP